MGLHIFHEVNKHARRFFFLSLKCIRDLNALKIKIIKSYIMVRASFVISNGTVVLNLFSGEPSHASIDMTATPLV